MKQTYTLGIKRPNVSPRALQADGWDDCIVGVKVANRRRTLVYDINRMVDTMSRRDGCSEEEAREYIDFNVLGGRPCSPWTQTFIEEY